ncbi:MAG: biotin--[acetyl-CoA-carboxylase] ligase [Hyphomicrobiaceae bacterium]
MVNVAVSLSDRTRLVHLPEIDSTNAEALRRAAAGERGPLWIVADRQTKGRGRSGRRWVSAPGNLHASLLIELACPPGQAQRLSLLAGVAAVEAIREASGRTDQPAGLCLKWPNDVMIGGVKAGGILIECTTAGGRFVGAVGIGINVATQPLGVDSVATHLGAHALALYPHDVFIPLAAAMERWLTIWNDGTGFEQVRSAWLAEAAAPGTRLGVSTGNGTVTGTFAGLDSDGALLLDGADGIRRRFMFGDVTSD